MSGCAIRTTLGRVSSSVGIASVCVRHSFMGRGGTGAGIIGCIFNGWTGGSSLMTVRIEVVFLALPWAGSCKWTGKELCGR